MPEQSRDPTLRILLDENVDRLLKSHFHSDFEVVIVSEQGWAGLSDGDVLRRARPLFSSEILSGVFLPTSAELHVMALQKQHSRCRGTTSRFLPREEDSAMETKTISLRVSADVADAYESASAEEKRKLAALLSSRLREAVRHRKRGRSLEEIMDEMSRRAQERGLTREKMDEILSE